MRSVFQAPVTTVFQRRVDADSKGRYEDWLDSCQEDVSTLGDRERRLTLAPGPDVPNPPRYKTAALILLGLYPLVLLLDVILGPLLSDLPRPVGLLISLLVSVATMVWSVLPWLTRVFHGWLHPGAVPQEFPGGTHHRVSTEQSSHITEAACSSCP